MLAKGQSCINKHGTLTPTWGPLCQRKAMGTAMALNNWEHIAWPVPQHQSGLSLCSPQQNATPPWLQGPSDKEHLSLPGLDK